MGKLSGVQSNIYNYIVNKTMREPEVLQQLRKETAELGGISIMQISPDQGQFFRTLVKMLQPKKIVEVGVFTGYSSLAMALALPEEGAKIHALDISESWTSIAQKYWKKAGVDHKIDLQIAPAIDTLRKLEETECGTFDIGFIDADKSSYDAYYESILKLLRPGGVILLDNMIWSGAVADDSINDEDTVAIRALNAKIQTDPRVCGSLLTLGDGVFVVTKL